MKNRPTIIVLVVLSALLLNVSSCAGSSFKSIADQKGLTFGVSVQAGDILDPKSAALIKENFNLIVPENTMKWTNIRPKKDFWNWSDMDMMVAFAEKKPPENEGTHLRLASAGTRRMSMASRRATKRLPS